MEEKQPKKKFDEDVEKAIKLLREEYDKEVRQETKTAYKSVSKKRGFYRGDPVGYYDIDALQWRPSSDAPEANSDDAPEYCYVLNIIQAAIMILISAVASSGLPGNIFIPADPDDAQSIGAAKEAKAILELQARTIDFFWLWVDMWLLFCTDGPVLAYTRHVRSGTRFGVTEVPVQVPTEQEIHPEGIDCPDCQKRIALPDVKREEMGGSYCPHCGNALDGSQIQPPVMGPSLSMETAKEPNGKEIVSLFGVLETRRPFYCHDLSEHPWIGTDEEMSRDSLAAEFSELAEKIQGSGDSDDIEGSMARMRAQSPISMEGIDRPSPGIGPKEYLITYRRRWFRPECYFHKGIDKKTRAALQEKFPDGMFAQFYDTEVLDAINERMDDHLDLAYPLPGKGAYPPAMIDSLIPLQEGLNTAFNMKMEAMEYAAFAPVLYDRAIISKDIKNRKMRPADLVGVEIPPGKSIQSAIFQVEVKDIANSMQTFMNEVMGWVDFLVGAGGALRGGGVPNSRTAQAYAQARNQAMQRLSIAFQSSKNLKAKIEEKLVSEFVNNRTRDEVFAVPGPKGKDWEKRTIGLSLARGKVMAFAEDSETVPTTWTQKQGMLERIMQMAAGNPVLQGILSDPNNLELIFQTQGVPELTVPGRAERQKMLKRLDELAHGAPQQGPPQMTPIGPQPTPPQPSIPFDPVLDNPAIQLAVIREWMANGNGDMVPPQGQQNIHAYAEQVWQATQQQAQQQAQQSQPAKKGRQAPKGGVEGHPAIPERPEANAKMPQRLM